MTKDEYPCDLGAGPSIPRVPIVNGNSTSRTDMASEDCAELMEIPSTGAEFFEYRRRLFFAGLPTPQTPTSQPLPPTYVVPASIPPPLLPLSGKGKGRGKGKEKEKEQEGSASQLELILSTPGAEELQSTWDKGVGGIAKSLHAGRKLARPLRLGLVIKILRASWIQDGTWPKDDIGRPVKPPESPLIEGTDLFPYDEEDIYPPPNFSDKR